MVQTTLTKSNDLFGTFKDEMEKSALQTKRMEREKLALEAKNSASQLTIIQMFEERQAEQATLKKAQRQNVVLTALCKELKIKAGLPHAPTPADAEPTHAPEPEEVAREAHALGATTAPIG
jgi:hypothetical protein